MEKENINIVIADDHPIMLKGLFEELTANKYNVIGQAVNGMQALELVLTKQPTIALLDIDMPLLNGFEVIRMAREKGVLTKFIILSFHTEAEYISQAKGLKIKGFLLKEDSFFEIERCIKSVLKGEKYFSKSFGPERLSSASSELKKLQFLTASERMILKLVAQQTPSIKIAEALGVSKRTIEKHRSNIIDKLQLPGGTNSLTNWAIANKSVIMDL